MTLKQIDKMIADLEARLARGPKLDSPFPDLWIRGGERLLEAAKREREIVAEQEMRDAIAGREIFNQ